MGNLKKFWNQLRKRLHKTDDFIIIGDMNESSIILSDHNSLRTASFDNFVEEMEIYIANDGSPTYMKMRRDAEPYVSAIDVTMCSDPLSTLVTSWNTLDELDSDHFPIVTRFNFSLETLESNVKKPVKDWDGVRSDVKKALALEDVHKRPLALMRVIGKTLLKY